MPRLSQLGNTEPDVKVMLTSDYILAAFFLSWKENEKPHVHLLQLPEQVSQLDRPLLKGCQFLGYESIKVSLWNF